MKMSEHFNLPLFVEDYWIKSQPYISIGFIEEITDSIECDSETEARYVSYAINNHDRLQDQVEGLKEQRNTWATLFHEENKSTDHLVQENSELRKALVNLIETASLNEEKLTELSGVYFSGESEALCEARYLLNKLEESK